MNIFCRERKYSFAAKLNRQSFIFYKKKNYSIFTAMKLLSVFLMVLVFFCSVYPCTDIENFGFTESLEIQILPDNHNELGDNCSPFCICTCCSISYAFDTQFSLNNFLYSSQSIEHFQNYYLFNPLLSIWQPPKA